MEEFVPSVVPGKAKPVLGATTQSHTHTEKCQAHEEQRQVGAPRWCVTFRLVFSWDGGVSVPVVVPLCIVSQPVQQACACMLLCPNFLLPSSSLLRASASARNSWSRLVTHLCSSRASCRIDSRPSLHKAVHCRTHSRNLHHICLRWKATAYTARIVFSADQGAA
jgi:hypothetical protein